MKDMFTGFAWDGVQRDLYRGSHIKNDRQT